VEIPRNPFLLGGPRGEIGYLAFAVFVEDNRTFALILSIPPWDRDLRALKSEHAYMTAALSLPAVAPWVHPDQSEPITPVLPMGSLQNLHRSLITDGEPVAAGIQPVGDALCHTNPTFAYGAVLSIQHGFALADIAGRTEDPRARALAFDDAVGADAAARFDAVSAEDRDRLRLWRGEPINVREPGDSIALFLRMTAYPSAAKDAGLFRAVARRVNMLDPPGKLEHDAALITRAPSRSHVTPQRHRQAGPRVRNYSQRSSTSPRRPEPTPAAPPRPARPASHRRVRTESTAGSRSPA
jgi:hypothetical protein